MIDATQLRELIIRPTLKGLDLWSEEAEDLLMGTAAQESHMGTYIKQLSDGPALGIYQMEPATYKDIWENYLKYRGELVDDIFELCGNLPVNDLIGNLYYATVMTRVHYLRVPEPLPSKDSITYTEDLAHYWKNFYNTSLGKGTEKEFIDNYRKYVL